MACLACCVAIAGSSLRESVEGSVHDQRGVVRADGTRAFFDDPEASDQIYKWHRAVRGPPLENVVYMHVPKTGSNFQILVLRAACRVELQLPSIEPSTMKELTMTHCPDAFRHFASGHAPLRPVHAAQNDSILITMVREPGARAASGFFHNLHDCSSMQKRLGIRENDFNTLEVTHFYQNYVRATAPPHQTRTLYSFLL